jgi:hypothetical protein
MYTYIEEARQRRAEMGTAKMPKQTRRRAAVKRTA